MFRSASVLAPCCRCYSCSLFRQPTRLSLNSRYRYHTVGLWMYFSRVLAVSYVTPCLVNNCLFCRSDCSFFPNFWVVSALCCRCEPLRSLRVTAPRAARPQQPATARLTAAQPKRPATVATVPRAPRPLVTERAPLLWQTRVVTVLTGERRRLKVARRGATGRTKVALLSTPSRFETLETETAKRGLRLAARRVSRNCSRVRV